MIEHKIDLLDKLKTYLCSSSPELEQVKKQAENQNSWFTPPNIDYAIQVICTNYLDKKLLFQFFVNYAAEFQNTKPLKVGIIMAGNIPLVGFHDFLCGFLSPHLLIIKPSSKDSVLIMHCIEKLFSWDNTLSSRIQFATLLNNCDAYIATGGNISNNYFNYYFNKFPHIIHPQKTSVALLSGNESEEELIGLGKDIFRYFGLGCRNVTQIYIPENYDFKRLLSALNQYETLMDNHKYKNNYDYNLAIFLLNKQYYMSNKCLLLIEEKSPFSPISVLHYQYYSNYETQLNILKENPQIQTIVAKQITPFGGTQTPSITDFADQIDTMKFLASLT